MPGSRVNADVWISEYMTPYDVYQHGVVRILAHKRTDYQEMYIVDSGVYGKALVLDGKWQSCTGDEFLYHEALVHPPCYYHGNPRRVLVLGGGEGATVREVLKWKSVEKVVMVDIDRDVVEACKQHLPEMHQGALDDPRTELVIGDALEFLGASENEWDIVISDLSDPIEEGPSFKLFTKEYFEQCRRALKAGGCFVIQAGPTAPPEMALHVRLVNTVKAAFENVASYASHVPSYASPFGFALGSAMPIDLRPDPATVDKVLGEKTTGKFKMLDGAAMLGLMNTPKYLRDAIEAETRVYTLDEPPKFFGEGIGRR
ncbi:MAG: methyltransferase domain-containing protein [Phycisphaerales bacterium]|nr:MAG: methyltransferase domain-containing protein [Phycisphaerales bacterium]